MRNYEKVIERLQQHIEQQENASVYAGGDGLAYLNWGSERRKGVSEFNIRKYLIRYFARGAAKANNPTDLLKAIHYALLEYGSETELFEKEGLAATKEDRRLNAGLYSEKI